MGHKSYSLAELASHVGGEAKGDENTIIQGVGTLSNAASNDISFLTNPKYKGQLQTTKAAAVILNEKAAADYEATALVHANPHAAFARIAQLFDTTPVLASDIHPSAVVHPSAKIGAGVALGANVVVEAGVVIGNHSIIGANSYIGHQTTLGEKCVINPNVTLYHNVKLGNRVKVHSQSVIGADGFGYANDAGTWIPIPQTGSVVVGDDTQIGASTTIDRGAIEDTVIGKNVIIDNQVQIAHNVIIDDHSCICGSTGIAGSCHIGKYVVIGGGCGINGHISICDKVQITGYTMVIADITEPGVYSSGQPAMKNRDWLKNAARLRSIDSVIQRVKALEQTK